MPLHPEVSAFLTGLNNRGMPPLDQLPVPTNREVILGLRAAQGDQEKIHDVSDILVPGPAGRLPVRIYRPVPPGGSPRPLIVFFHGGGWIAGNLELVDRPLRRLANGTGAIVASVEYRLAPETQFPGPVEDAYAAVVALATRAKSLGADPTRVAVAGESAGGNLAAAVALMARDRDEPALGLQILLYPLLAPAAGSPFGSYEENAHGYLVTRDAMLRYWELYVADSIDARDPYAAPLTAPDLSGLPPALIVSAEYDPVRDEAEEYGHRLRYAGVRTTVARYDGMIHAFFLLSGTLSTFGRAVDDISLALSAELNWDRPATDSHV